MQIGQSATVGTFVATNQLTKRATSDLKELRYIVLGNQETNPLTKNKSNTCKIAVVNHAQEHLLCK